MKLVYLHQYFNTPEMVGSTRSYEMAKRIAAAGHEVHVVTSRRGIAASNEKWSAEEISGFTVHWVEVPYKNNMSYARRMMAFFSFALKAAFQTIKIKPTIIFATSTPLTIALPAIFAKKYLKIPMVFEVRDLWPDVPIELNILTSRPLIWLARKLEISAYRNSQSVVALSPDMCAGVVSKGVPKESVYNIPNSCDFDLFAVEPNLGLSLRKRFNWLGKNPLVLYTGTLGKINGVSYMVTLAAKVAKIDPDIRFLIVGEGVEQAEVERLARELGVLNNNFFMFPSVPKTELVELVSAATVVTSFVIPIEILWGNSANKFFDGLAAGKPIVINHEGWQADMIRSNNVGLVLDSKDFDLASRAIVDLLHDPLRLEECSKNSTLLGMTQFSRDKLAKKLLSVLEKS